MAEQYPVYRPQEPKIDIRLFPDVANQGINAGNAQMTTTSAIAQGVSGAIRGGIEVASAWEKLESIGLANEAQAARNKIDTDPAVIAAKKQVEIARGEKASLEAYEAQLSTEVAQANEETLRLQKVASLEAAREKAVNERDDLINMKAITTDLLDPAKLNEIPNNPAYTQTLMRHPEFAAKVIGSLEQSGADPRQVAGMRAQFDAMETQKQRQRYVEAQERAKLQAQADAEKEYGKALRTITFDPVLKQYTGDQARDPSKLYVVQAGSIKKNPVTKQYETQIDGSPVFSEIPSEDKRYVAIENGNVLAYYDENTGKKYAEALPYVKSRYATLVPSPLQTTQRESAIGLGGTLESALKEAPSLPQPSPRPMPTLDPKVLEGKSEADRLKILERFEQQSAKLAAVPREYRETVKRVKNNPTLANAQPLMQAIAAKESLGGKLTEDGKTSPTGVRGIMQVTKGTYDLMAKKYPKLGLTPEAYDTDLGQLVAAQAYVNELLVRFSDIRLAMAAYNAGPENIQQAITVSRSRSWDDVKEVLPSIIGTEKYERETKNFPDDVLKYFEYFR